MQTYNDTIYNYNHQIYLLNTFTNRIQCGMPTQYTHCLMRLEFSDKEYLVFIYDYTDKIDSTIQYISIRIKNTLSVELEELVRIDNEDPFLSTTLLSLFMGTKLELSKLNQCITDIRYRYKSRIIKLIVGTDTQYLLDAFNILNTTDLDDIIKLVHINPYKCTSNEIIECIDYKIEQIRNIRNIAKKLKEKNIRSFTLSFLNGFKFSRINKKSFRRRRKSFML